MRCDKITMPDKNNHLREIYADIAHLRKEIANRNNKIKESLKCILSRALPTLLLHIRNESPFSDESESNPATFVYSRLGLVMS